MGLANTIAALFSRSTKPNSGSDPRHRLGRRGERLAEKFLRKSGYKILHRNYRPKHGGEVDLVCRDGNELVFAEVKTRTHSDEHSRPADAVTREKEELICRGARSWLQLLDNRRIVFRFDIVEVVIEPDREPRCNVIKSAFQLPEERRR